jgi:hypothetical protein
MLDGMEFYQRGRMLCLVGRVGSLTPDIRAGLNRHRDDLIHHGSALASACPHWIVQPPAKPGEVAILF